MNRDTIDSIWQDVNPYFSSFHFELAGSYRRGSNEPKDLNVLIEAPASVVHSVLYDFRRKNHCEMIKASQIAKATSQCVIEYRSLSIHLLCCNADTWGSNLLFWTGSKRFTIAFRTWAKQQGFHLNRHGLFFNETLIAAKTEEQIFYALGSEYMRPEERE